MAAGAARPTVARPTGIEPGRATDRHSAAAHHTNGTDSSRQACCGLYHRAVELVGKRWGGAILLVLMDGPLRFSEIRQLVPDLSDRLLSQRLKELELEEIVERHVIDSTPLRVEYSLTEKGRALEPTIRTLKAWASDWLC
jgi:DNA-binding HxlR family transcriptional regulator